MALSKLDQLGFIVDREYFKEFPFVDKKIRGVLSSELKRGLNFSYCFDCDMRKINALCGLRFQDKIRDYIDVSDIKAKGSVIDLGPDLVKAKIFEMLKNERPFVFLKNKDGYDVYFINKNNLGETFITVRDDKIIHNGRFYALMDFCVVLSNYEGLSNYNLIEEMLKELRKKNSIFSYDMTKGSYSISTKEGNHVIEIASGNFSCGDKKFKSLDDIKNYYSGKDACVSDLKKYVCKGRGKFRESSIRGKFVYEIPGYKYLIDVESDGYVCHDIKFNDLDELVKNIDLAIDFHLAIPEQPNVYKLEKSNYKIISGNKVILFSVTFNGYKKGDKIYRKFEDLIQ